jgi:glycosyltransferase involved in cell wall biosynthesis
MPKIAFLPLYGIHRPSSRYRLFQFLEPLKSIGWRFSILPSPERNFRKRFFYVFRFLLAFFSHNVFFIQKRILPISLLTILKCFNKKLIFDFDDAIYLRPHVTSKINKMISLSNVVIVGNETLRKYAVQFNKKVVVIPTVVDTSKYRPALQPRHNSDHRTIIGWIGSDPNRGDLDHMKPVFDWVGNNYKDRVVFQTIGSRPLEMETELTLEFVPWTLEKSISELQKFDIGIMPLHDNAWNRGKCGLKLIQYMAVGAAPISSQVGINNEIIEHGVSGFLASNDDEWIDYLSQLIDEKVRRKRIGEAARVRIESRYSVKSVLPLLIETLGLVK